MATAEQVLRDAADILRRDGWCQGDLHRNGKHCILGALNMATDFGNTKNVREYIYRVIDGRSAAGFNDENCKTIDDAIAVLEIAADLAAPAWTPPC